MNKNKIFFKNGNRFYSWNNKRTIFYWRRNDISSSIYIFIKIKDIKARGTSIFCILPMVLTSSFFYYKGNYINWKIAFLCALGGAIGGYIGARLLKKLPEKILKSAFAIFLIYVAVRMLTAN